MKSSVFKQLENPLSPEHWIMVEGIYNSIRRQRQSLFWVRYLRRQAVKRIGSLTWEGESPTWATMGLHRELFNFPDPMLLRGVIHHEMIHLLLGPEARHNERFIELEQGWVDFEIYSLLKSPMFATLRMLREHDSQNRSVD